MTVAPSLYAECDRCGWHGSRMKLRHGPAPLDERCPACLSADTWWTDEPPPEGDDD